LIAERRRESSKEYVRKVGCGRKPKEARLVFEAIVYVLRTGCQWKALPAERFELGQMRTLGPRRTSYKRLFLARRGQNTSKFECVFHRAALLNC